MLMLQQMMAGELRVLNSLNSARMASAPLVGQAEGTS
jgi:hypothetical protein